MEVANLYKEKTISKIDFPFTEVLNIVEKGTPVLVWNTIGLSIPYISASWKDRDTNEIVNWIANEHALVVIGYNDNQVIVSDPYSGTIKYLNRKTFEERYNYLGRRAIYYET